MPESNELTEKIEGLEAKAHELLETAENDPAKADDLKAVVENDIQPQLEKLTADKDREVQEQKIEGVKAALTSLGDEFSKVKDELRKPGDFTFGTEPVESNDYPEGKSFFADVKAANKGRQDAIERLSEYGGKALVEGTENQGGYLVNPDIERRIKEAIELNNKVRGLCSQINVTTNELQFEDTTFAATAGWVAELAAKPESTAFTQATVTVNVFTAAGLVTTSNQLLADARPAIDSLIAADLAKRIVALEEISFISGTGTGQPRGILNQSGIAADTLTGTTGAALADQILKTIAEVENAHGAPTAILLHPRTWTRLLLEKDTAGKYIIEPQDSVQDNRTVASGPGKSLWGYPVVTSNRIPTNLGAGTNESRVIVGDFSEALVIDREGFVVDESPHVYFTSNQTVFRGEKRLGFTAGRNVAAFRVIGGAGLAGG